MDTDIRIQIIEEQVSVLRRYNDASHGNVAEFLEGEAGVVDTLGSKVFDLLVKMFEKHNAEAVHDFSQVFGSVQLWVGSHFAKVGIVPLETFVDLSVRGNMTFVVGRKLWQFMRQQWEDVRFFNAMVKV